MCLLCCSKVAAGRDGDTHTGVTPDLQLPPPRRPTPAAAGAASLAASLWQRLREDCQDSEQTIVKDPLIQCSSTRGMSSGTWKLTHIGIICRFGVTMLNTLQRTLSGTIRYFFKCNSYRKSTGEMRIHFSRVSFFKCECKKIIEANDVKILK